MVDLSKRFNALQGQPGTKDQRNSMAQQDNCQRQQPDTIPSAATIANVQPSLLTSTLIPPISASLTHLSPFAYRLPSQNTLPHPIKPQNGTPPAAQNVRIPSAARTFDLIAVICMRKKSVGAIGDAFVNIGDCLVLNAIAQINS
ncbi:hypothetical protein L596_028485 [Steinernema carpocapsae]|uniref:Uncharacterized protein n=1 Tax=Steinernema carpocapsae TaxID=34508 RepID=A0A4U5LYM9_STECR|nr:hypothetical protein L596_028485 [Steinernema carpocapsae]